MKKPLLFNILLILENLLIIYLLFFIYIYFYANCYFYFIIFICQKIQIIKNINNKKKNFITNNILNTNS